MSKKSLEKYDFQPTTHPAKKNLIQKISGKRKFHKKCQACRILEIGGETFAESRFETLSLSWVIALFIGLGGDNNSHLACWVALYLLYTFQNPLYFFTFLRCTAPLLYIFKILFTFLTFLRCTAKLSSTCRDCVFVKLTNKVKCLISAF